MSLPATVRVKLSSEAAEGISITRVVVQDLPLRELVEHMLGITGRDAGRIRELLLRGTLVSGASRFRWTGWESDLESIQDLLATFPSDDPTRPFCADRCVRAVLRGGRQAIELPRAAAARKPPLRKSSFWDLLMNAAAAGQMQYLRYSHKDRADCYRVDLPRAATEQLRAAGEIVRYSTLRDQIRSLGFAWVELFVER
ncbi:MAG TPA: hypothetical protein VMT86_00860 [Bryobacteraceae bacterium]|nr:hypothetical protein [Bryobacteraceae bacterium]